MKSIWIYILLFCTALSGKAQENEWRGFEKDSIISSMDGYVNRFHYYQTLAKEKKPLIVSIHQWSADYTHFKNSLAEQAKKQDWNFIFPDLRGPNNHPKACGSDYLIADIDQTIEWAVQHLPVDTTCIYMVGASGGGYNALCHFMKSRYPIKEYSIWVPITDLNSWYYESESRKNKYAQDILNCTDKPAERSPINWITPTWKLEKTRLHLYAGIHDGYTGAVPITHSLHFYNKIATDIGIIGKGLVSPEEMTWMLTTRTSPFVSTQKIGDRDIIYAKNAGNLSITLFEGGHEIIADEVINELTLHTISPWIWDMRILQDVKKSLQLPAYSDAYQALLKEASQALKQAPFSVVNKKKTAPSGDKHDYVSLSRYRWPDPSKKDGLPYIVKDGESNPELEQYDRIPLHAMSNAVTTLAQAYFFSNEERYAQKAVEILRTWFLNKSTYMNPSLNYSQFVPGLNESKGTSAGLIDTYCFVEMLNGVKLLESSAAYTPEDKKGLENWFARFAQWMQTSPQGIIERNTDSNHGVAYDVQLALYLLFSGNKEEAKKIITDFPSKRLFVQIEPDGKQPRELRRTLAFHYSTYNIRHMIEMFLIAQKEGIIIWDKESNDKRSFNKAVDFLLPYLGKNVSEWPYKQVSDWEPKQQEFCADLFRITLLDPSRKDLIDSYLQHNKRGTADRFRLLYGAPEQSSYVLNTHIQVKPTFESCSVYAPFSRIGSECKLYYKKTSEKEWQEGYPPVYNEENKEFRGSLVHLDEHTDYDVRTEIYIKGTKVKEYTTTFQTWSPNPTIVKTLKISQFKESDSPSYLIKDLIGEPDGWIRIIGDEEVSAINTRKQYAIKIENSHYVILENIKVTGGGRHGILVPQGSSHIRVLNCNISKWGRTSQNQSERGVYLDEENNKINFDAGVRLEQVENVVVERCYIHDPKAKTNPWRGMIEEGPYKGTAYKSTHPEGPSGIYVRQAIGGIVLRYNDLIGGQIHRFNDAIETGENGGKDGGFHRDADIYGNVLAFGQDDGVELDGAQCNVRFFNNRIEQMLCGISTAPNMQGPSYIFNNVVWNLGDVTGNESVSVKNGGGTSYSLGRQFFFHNTMVVTKNGMAGIGFGKDTNREMFIATTRNNIFVSDTKPVITGQKGSGLSISDIHVSPWNDFDYDMIGNSCTSDGAGMILAYAGSERNGVFAMPQFVNRQQAVFTLKNEDKGIDKGTIIPNFSIGFRGKAPDLGAFELGSPSLFPIRPLAVESNKYYVVLKPGVPETITLTVGKIAYKGRFAIHKSDDMDWLSVISTSRTIKPDSKIMVTLKSDNRKTMYRKQGMMIIRLENGLSVPITVSAESDN